MKGHTDVILGNPVRSERKQP